ncbi:ASKHA domain-containing protein [Thermoanaerobacterium thermosaccharolyticum]|uniref:Putative metal-binding protein n=1 Tax=Thermoanaerobacterium thermosaccharolyticum M0795 TaxID=698948 RepID=L0IPC1_THETR|nr:ASKHA domain-containing protein [Thermoanaerobacterium thermosaccharolyticum]AGB20076.1 putative metal-binding protein [Thermoanaerobacterium thermosaccharolyticum M0795]
MDIRSYELEIDEKSVLRYLGYRDVEVDEDLLNEVRNAIDEAHQLIVPTVSFDRFAIKYDDAKDEIIVSSEDTLNDDYIVDKLKSAEYVIMAVATVKGSIENASFSLFKEGKYLDGMIYDAIGNAALDKLCEKFYSDLANEALKEGLGTTEMIFPGDSKWDINAQKIIFKNLDASKIGVALDENYTMHPMKSLSFVLGVGKGLRSNETHHDCRKCDFSQCIYRMVRKKKHIVKVNYRGKHKEIEVYDGGNLFKVLVENGVPVPNSCGGYHTCGKCKVIVNERIPMINEEMQYLSDVELEKGIRLSCFLNVDRDLDVTVLDEGDISVFTDSIDTFKLNDINPRVKKKIVKMDLPTLDDQRDDLRRVSDSLGSDVKMSLSVLRTLPDILESNNYNVALALRNNEVISVEAVDSIDSVYGISFDIGTTTIAAYLYDLRTGARLDVYSDVNPQRSYGADVISRINYTITEDNGLFRLHRIMIDEINKIVNAFCTRNAISKENIYEIVIVGNTVMIHLALGVTVKNIANSPYIPAFTYTIELKANTLGININKEGYIVTLPMVASYVGADTVAAVLSSRIFESDEICLLVDIGTNGEIVLGNKEFLISCSAAAGPAFEGADITFGMSGVEGAIDHVDLKRDPIFSTIGGKKSKGICGSGIVDVIAELFKHGIVDNTGRILDKDEVTSAVGEKYLDRIVQYNEMPAFLIDDENGIYLTQKDVRQVQLAKAAIRAGINILINEVGISETDIKRVYLAGGFGSYISIESAATIGLIPSELKDRTIQIGNAAGLGASLALLSDNELNRAKIVRDKIKYIELSNVPTFQEEFIKSMYF